MDKDYFLFANLPFVATQPSSTTKTTAAKTTKTKTMLVIVYLQHENLTMSTFQVHIV